MTLHQSTATDGRSSPTSAPESAAATYASVNGGELSLLLTGHMRPVSRITATAILSELNGSPFPSSQERARQIRAALKETVQ